MFLVPHTCHAKHACVRTHAAPKPRREARCSHMLQPAHSRALQHACPAVLCMRHAKRRAMRRAAHDAIRCAAQKNSMVAWEVRD
eukprot:3879219-Rhodomonas_salina.1